MVQDFDSNRVDRGSLCGERQANVERKLEAEPHIRGVEVESGDFVDPFQPVQHGVAMDVQQ